MENLKSDIEFYKKKRALTLVSIWAFLILSIVIEVIYFVYLLNLSFHHPNLPLVLLVVNCTTILMLTFGLITIIKINQFN